MLWTPKLWGIQSKQWVWDWKTTWRNPSSEEKKVLSILKYRDSIGTAWPGRGFKVIRGREVQGIANQLWFKLLVEWLYLQNLKQSGLELGCFLSQLQDERPFLIANPTPSTGRTRLESSNSAMIVNFFISLQHNFLIFFCDLSTEHSYMHIWMMHILRVSLISGYPSILGMFWWVNVVSCPSMKVHTKDFVQQEWYITHRDSIVMRNCEDLSHKSKAMT